MNYVTNYYKNLSEQLQEKLYLLESYFNQLNEDLSAGTMSQGYSSSNSTSTNQNQNSNQGLNALLAAWGPVDSNSGNAQYDLNGDGFVDGDDLGQFLANMSAQNNSQNNPQLAQPTLSGGNIGTVRNRNTVTAIDQPGVAGNFGQGSPGSYGDGGSPRPPSPKPGPGGRRPTVTGVDNYTNMGNPVTPGGGSPRPPSPKPGPGGRGPTNTGVGVYTPSGNPVTPGGGSPRPPAPKPGPGGRGPTNTGVGVYTPSGNPVTPGGGSPRPPSPKPGPGGRPMQPTAGGFDTTTITPNPLDTDSGFGNFGNPITPPNQPRQPTKTGPNFGTQSEIGGGFNVGSGIPPTQTPMSGINQEGVPYWMSQRTTQADSSFRDMQRRRKF